MKIKSLILTVLFLQVLNTVNSQIYPDFYRISYGVFTDLNLNLHPADFNGLAGYPNCCEGFDFGFGTGLSTGIYSQVPLMNKLKLQVRIMLSDKSAEFTKNEKTIMGIAGNSYNGEFRHTISANLLFFKMEPLLAYDLSDDFALLLGCSIGYTLEKSFSQNEEILYPDIALYSNNTKTNNVYKDKNINNVNLFSASIDAGIMYNFALDKENTFIIAPELFLDYHFLPVSKNVDWYAHSIRLGISFQYTPQLKREKIIPPETPGPLFPPPAPFLFASVTAKGVSNNTEMDIMRMQIEELLSLRTLPLLNYIFFDHNSYDLPSRYTVKGRKKNNPNTKKEPALQTYWDVLNIIGKRMHEYPEAKIVLRGCNSNIEEEKDNLVLSMKRTETIYNYLKNNWQIESDRIKIEAMGLSAKSSSVDIDSKDGSEENRRVEIEADTWEILQPITIGDTIRSINPPIIRFYLNVESSNEITYWNLKVFQDTNTIKQISGRNSAPSVIEWMINESEGWEIDPNTDLQYSLEVIDAAGNTAPLSKGSIPIEILTLQRKKELKIKDKIIETYQLILFDFDRDEINRENLKIIEKIINPGLKPESEIIIHGFTDRKGDASHNYNLSVNRANNIVKYLNNKNIIENIGFGESNLYNNEWPEGRFYSRTVFIQVETE